MFFRKKKPPSPAETATPDATSAQGKEQRGWFSGRGGRDGSREARAALPPPVRKPRRDGLIGLFSGAMTVALVIAVIATVLGMQARRGFSEAGPLAQDHTVIIERGASTEEIVDTLQREGVITHSTWLWAALLYRDLQSKFSADAGSSKRAKAGEYLFKARVSLSEVIDIVTSGRSIEHSITIPEGLTSEQIVQRIRDAELLAGEIAQIPPEGALLPDTYRITRGFSRQALIDRMQREQRRLAADIWARRAKDLPIRSARELVILASIVEKETGRADERPRVASVFYNRLEKRMKLQSDPTIIYGLVGGKATLGRGLTREEISRPTPYNTYVITGLPPGPIANPGRAAMEATANPSQTKDLFFVADGTGGHAFAETLEQHNRNVARWRQIEAQRAQQPASLGAPPAAAAPAPGFAPLVRQP